MINWILSKIAGKGATDALVKTQGFLSGKKTYVAGTILILQGLTCLIEQFSGLSGLAGVIGLLRSANENECLTKIAEGLGLMGLRAAMNKPAVPPA
jgi:hypothetical protein